MENQACIFFKGILFFDSLEEWARHNLGMIKEFEKENSSREISPSQNRPDAPLGRTQSMIDGIEPDV